jgi:nucleoid DNA-binding protein
MATSTDIAKACKLDVPTIEGVFEAILLAVARGERVAIRGFGSFERKTHLGRTQTTPIMTGGSITYPDKTIIKFKASDTAKERLNRKKASKKKTKKAAK